MGACGFGSDIRVSSSWGNGTGFGSFPHFVSKQNPTDNFWLGLGVTSSRKHASIPSLHPELWQLTSRCFGLRPWVPITACRLSCLGRWSNDINVLCGLQGAQEDVCGLAHNWSPLQTQQLLFESAPSSQLPVSPRPQRRFSVARPSTCEREARDFFFFLRKVLIFKCFNLDFWRPLTGQTNHVRASCGPQASSLQPLFVALPVPLHRFHHTRQGLCCALSASQAAGSAWWA